MTAIELGTDAGGFAALLAHTLAEWGGRVVTFDRERKFFDALLTTYRNLEFVQTDILSVHGYDRGPRLSYLQHLVASDAVLLYCDNGNKVREIELYAPLLRTGSMLATHDYGSEVPAAWCEEFVARLGFMQVGHARMETLRNEWYPEPMTRFWGRVSQGVR